MAAPFDLENERTLIVAALKDSAARVAVKAALKHEDFLGERYRVLFSAIMECARLGLQPDPDAISVHSHGQDFGGLGFVAKLLELQPTANLGYHITRQRQDAARARARKTEIPELERLLGDKSIEHHECLKKLADLQRLLQVEAERTENPADRWCRRLDARCAGEVTFQSVGYESVNEHLLDGYAKKSVSLIAARTGNGKTTFVTDTVRRLLRENKKPRVCVLPLEIGEDRFLDKLVSSATCFPTEKVRKKPDEMLLAERDKLKATVRKLIGTDDRLEVMDNPFFKLPEWTNETSLEEFERILAVGRFDIVFIDLFQRMLVDIRPASVEIALAKVQHLAKQYSVHLCLLHQINRRAEEREDKRPALIDLKGSGGYEEVPDLILLLHRPKAYKPFMRKDRLEILIAKQRDGMNQLTFEAEFKPAVCRLENDKRAVAAEVEKMMDEPQGEATTPQSEEVF